MRKVIFSPAALLLVALFLCCQPNVAFGTGAEEEQKEGTQTNNDNADAFATQAAAVDASAPLVAEQGSDNGAKNGVTSKNNGDGIVRVEVQLERHTLLHVWMRARQEGKPAKLYRQQQGLGSSMSPTNTEPKVEYSQAETRWFVYRELSVHAPNGPAVFFWHTEETEISYFYAFEPEKVKANGIRPAYIRPEARHNPALAQHSFHLRAPLGWANEPNGFSRDANGLYHVFYQHIPSQNKRFWFGFFKKGEDYSALYPTVEALQWGHAVSTDLVNWVHMPIFLRAIYHKDEAQEDYEWPEHWFSGSAIAFGNNGLRVFVTNFQMGRPIWSQQKEVISYDGIKPTAEPSLLIEDFPQNAEYSGKTLQLAKFNFRDPNVLLGPGGYYYMTLGTEDQEQGGTILLYRSARPDDLNSGWEYQSVLLTDNRDEMGNAECPGMIPMGDPADSSTLYALLYGREKGHEGHIYRERDTLLVLGTFDGKQFKKISEKTLDFAFGSYGHQGFYDPKSKTALLMGWLAWWLDWDFKSDFFSSQTLPRVLKVAPNGRDLLVGPHPAVLDQLRGKRLADGEELAKGGKVPLPNGTGYVRLVRKGNGSQQQRPELLLSIEHPLYSKLAIRLGKDGMELIKTPKQKDISLDARRFVEPLAAQVDIVHVFIDRDSLEIYGEEEADGGMPRYTATAHLMGNGVEWVRSVQLESNASSVKKTKASGVWAMRAARQRGHFDQSPAAKGGSGARRLLSKHIIAPLKKNAAALGKRLF